MKHLLCLALLMLALAPAPSRAAGAPSKIALRIFYAGHPGSARETDFVGFLKQYFAEVRTGDYAKFSAAYAKDSDVVILDYDGDGFKAPRLNLREDYRRATVTVGVAGGLLCGGLGLKSGYT